MVINLAVARAKRDASKLYADLALHDPGFSLIKSEVAKGKFTIEDFEGAAVRHWGVSRLVAYCLFDKFDEGRSVKAITDILEKGR